MTTVTRIIERARLQAACEQAWRKATHLHNADAWKLRRERRLPLTALYPSAKLFDPNALPEATISPCCEAVAITEVTGIVIRITAPQFDRDFSWNACKFHWSRPGMTAVNLEHNYTI